MLERQSKLKQPRVVGGVGEKRRWWGAVLTLIKIQSSQQW